MFTIKEKKEMIYPEQTDAGEAKDYQKKAREMYLDHMPDNWDVAYSYFTDDNAPPVIQESDRQKIVNILNHGKYNRKLLRLSVITFIIFIVTLWAMDQISVFHIQPFLKMLLIVLQIMLIAGGIYTYRRDSFSSLRWLLPGMCIVWCVCIFFWLM